MPPVIGPTVRSTVDTCDCSGQPLRGVGPRPMPHPVSGTGPDGRQRGPSPPWADSPSLATSAMGTLCFWAMYPRKEKTTKPEEKLVRELTEVVMMASLEGDTVPTRECRFARARQPLLLPRGWARDPPLGPPGSGSGRSLQARAPGTSLPRPRGSRDTRLSAEGATVPTSNVGALGGQNLWPWGAPAHAGSGWWGGDLVRMQVLWEAGQMVPFPAAPGGRSCWSRTPLRAGQSRAAPAEGRPGVPRPGVQRGCAGLCQDMLWDPGRSPSGHFAARMLYFYCLSFSGCENVNDLRRSGRAGRRSKSAPVSSRALGSAGSGGSPRAFWAGRHSRAAVSAGGRRCHVLACLGPHHRGASAQRLGQPPDPGSVDSWVLPQGGQGRG